MLHSSDKPSNRVTFAATCYLDGSSLETKAAILAGCVLDRNSFIRLERRWSKLLSDFRIDSLHMTDFVRPHGRYIGMHREMKLALFADVVRIINTRKSYSIAVDVALDSYGRIFPPKFRRLLSPHTIAFIGVSQYNLKLAKDNKYPDQMSYVIDEGSAFPDQVLLGHRITSVVEKLNGQAFTGRIAFENDANNSAVQVADVVAWSVQRRASEAGLKNEFAPLAGIFRERFNRHGISIQPHCTYSVTDEVLQGLKDLLMAQWGSEPFRAVLGVSLT